MSFTKPDPQSSADRVFVKVPMDTVAYITAGDTFFFRNAIVTPDKKLVVVDGMTDQLLSLNNSGEVISRWGAGHGAGPGEHEAIEYFNIDEHGNLWTFDLSLNRVTIFSESGKLLRTIKFDEKLHQIIMTEGGFVGFSLFEPPNFLFFDSDGLLIERNGTFEVDGPDQSIAFVGHLRTNGSDIVFVTMHHPLLVGVQSDSDKLIYSRRTMNGGNNRADEPVTQKERSTSTGVNLQFEQRILNVWEETVYIVIHEFDDSKAYIDAYNIETGDYEYSMRVPMSTGCGPFYVTNTHQYIHCGGDIAIVERNDRFASKR